MRTPAFFLLIAIATCVAGSGYDPKRTRLIDWTPSSSSMSNFLFRGNEPKNSTGQFAYKEMQADFISQAKLNNITFPSDYYLIIISFENEFVESSDISMELDFFAKNPSLGKFINWPIYGSLLAPEDFPESIRKVMVKDFSSWGWIDKVPQRVENMRTILYTKLNKPAVIYIHCEAGTDRTGEMSGSYYIRYLGMTFQQALYIDNHIQNRDIYTMSRNGFQWYCYYLNYVKNVNIDCTLPNNKDIVIA